MQASYRRTSRDDELIEIYSPIRSRSTGEVIAAAEFYYATDALAGDVAAAQRRSWLVVGGATLVIYLLLATFIQRISNTVRRQQRKLSDQVTPADRGRPAESGAPRAGARGGGSHRCTQ